MLGVFEKEQQELPEKGKGGEPEPCAERAGSIQLLKGRIVRAWGKVAIALVLPTTAHKQSHDHNRSQAPLIQDFLLKLLLSSKDSHVPCSN